MKEKKKVENKLILKRLIIISILFLIVLVVANYVANEDARQFINKNILRKQLDENTIKSIEINSDENPVIFGFNKYICVFSKNELKFYDSTTNIINTLNIEVSKPIMKSKGNYLLIAEEEGKSIYLIKNTNLIWKNEIEGNISSINVNENGYVSMVISDNTYKSIVYTYNPEGTQLFKYYLSTSLALGTDISKDNKYLVLGEIDFSGIKVKSKLKVISMDLAVSNPKNSTIKEYEEKEGRTIVSLKFSKNNEIIAMYNDSIIKYKEDANEQVLEINEDSIFVDISPKNNIISFEKESSGKFSFKYKVKIKEEQSLAESFYVLNSSIPKKVITNPNVIAMNFGTEVKIISTNAWLIKEYKSSKQIKDIVLGESILGIIYKDRVEIINF